MLREYSPREWIVAVSSMYAQVVEEPVTFESLTWSHSWDRPFTVSGHFEDAEILSIATLIREAKSEADPLKRAFTGISTDDPIRAMARISEETVRVDLSVNDWSALTLFLRRVGELWVVVRSFSWTS